MYFQEIDYKSRRSILYVGLVCFVYYQLATWTTVPSTAGSHNGLVIRRLGAEVKIILVVYSELQIGDNKAPN